MVRVDIWVVRDARVGRIDALVLSAWTEDRPRAVSRAEIRSEISAVAAISEEGCCEDVAIFVAAVVGIPVGSLVESNCRRNCSSADVLPSAAPLDCFCDSLRLLLSLLRSLSSCAVSSIAASVSPCVSLLCASSIFTSCASLSSRASLICNVSSSLSVQSWSGPSACFLRLLRVEIL